MHSLLYELINLLISPPAIFQAYYVRCPLHTTAMRSCSKQMSTSNKDVKVIARSLMWWLLQGKELGTCIMYMV